MRHLGNQFQWRGGAARAPEFRPARHRDNRAGEKSAPRAAIFLHAATGAAQRHYHDFANWLAVQGYACLTYDCRDFGTQLPVPDIKACAGPLKLVAVADDAMVPPAAVWRLMQYYPEAWTRQLTLRPADHGLEKIGHIGMCRRENAALWPEIMR